MSNQQSEQISDLPWLSLCLPTYNRAPLLRQAMEAVLSQAVAGVEVVVSDNASQDETSQVISHLQATYPNTAIRLFRQPENRGPDANIYAAVQQAQGEFVYILSDDDVLLPGALQKLLDLKSSYPEADAFALNVRVFSTDLWAPAPAEMQLASDTFVRTKDDALLIFNTWMRYISAMAFRRSLIAGTDYSSRMDTYFLQAYLFLDVLSKGRGVVFTAQPFIAQRDGNMTILNFCRVYVTHFAALLDHARALGCSESAIRPIHRRNIRILRTVIFSNTLSGTWKEYLPDPWDSAGRLLCVYGKEPIVLFQILPVLLVPQRLVPPLHRFYKRLRSIFRKVHYSRPEAKPSHNSQL